MGLELLLSRASGAAPLPQPHNTCVHEQLGCACLHSWGTHMPGPRPLLCYFMHTASGIFTGAVACGSSATAVLPNPHSLWAILPGGPAGMRCLLRAVHTGS